jgi:hypothetical protein
MEIKINSHPGGVPETGGGSMGSTYYSIHHHNVAFVDELKLLLDKNGVKYESKYLL